MWDVFWDVGFILKVLSYMLVLFIVIIILLLLLPAVSLGLLLHFPGVLHHQFEVLIVVDGGTNKGVVVKELVKGDFAIMDSTIGDVRFEGLEEFSKNFFLCFLPFLNFWVVRSIINSLQIINLNHTGMIPVQDVECLEHK